MTSTLIPLHSRVEYDSDRGVHCYGIILGYVFLGSTEQPDAYLIDIDPISSRERTLPLRFPVVIETERVQLSELPEDDFFKRQRGEE